MLLPVQDPESTRLCCAIHHRLENLSGSLVIYAATPVNPPLNWKQPMPENAKDNNQTPFKWAEIIAKAWTDEAFKKRLLKDPQKILKENGIPLLPEMTYVIHENSEHETHIVLPLMPKDKTEAEILSILASGLLPND